MWKPEHRLAADRRGLRYPSDLGDAEWTLVAPLIPPARRGGRRRSIDGREVLNAIFYVLATGCQWQALPKDLPPKSTGTSIFSCGIGTAYWSASTRRSMSRFERRLGEKQAQAPQSSTPRAPRRRKRGLVACASGLRCGQEGHGAQTPYPRRHFRSAPRRERSAGQHSGPRRRARLAEPSAAALSLYRADLRRRRIPGTENGEDNCRYRMLEDRDRQALRSSPLRRLAEAMGRRADLRLDQPKPPPDARLRTLCRNRRSLRPPRYDPPPAQTPDQAKPLLMNSFFLDRL